MPRAVEMREVEGVEAALATRHPIDAVRRVADVLATGADRKEVVQTAALAVARHFRPALPPSHGLLALGAAAELAAVADPPSLPVLQACALAAAEWTDARLPVPAHAVAGDALHLGDSFLVAVRGRDVGEADAVFAGLLREGEERRLAGDVLFEGCTQDSAGEGHKLTFAVGSWRLARVLGWTRGATLLRPTVHLLAGTESDASAYAATMREVGRSRLDLELAARNEGKLDEVARNAYGIGLQHGPDRVVSELIAGLKRGRAPQGYADLVATTAAEHLTTNPVALEVAIGALAARFVLGFSRTASHVLAVLLTARRVADMGAPEPPSPARIADPQAALNELELAIEGDDEREAARLVNGLTEAIGGDLVFPVLLRQAILEDAHGDAGHRLLYASWIRDLASVGPGPAYASLAALLARTPKSRTVAEAVIPS